MSRSDSVPAPMVQAAANVCEHFYAWFSPAGSSHGAEICTLCHYPNPAWLDRIHAAPPAASVPAADILALAEHYTAQDGIEYPLGLVPCAEVAERLRALVAAAEQADKGEAADTPRDDDLFADLAGHPDDTPMSGEAAIQYAPAAPPEPLCRCGHTKTLHEFSRYECGTCGWIGCKRFTRDEAAAVPVSDDAETTAGLLEVVRRLVSTYKHLQMDTPKDQAILDKATDLAERALDTLAARLADSRPVVSEADR